MSFSPLFKRLPKRLLVTGGAGFIGSFFIRYLLRMAHVERVVNYDLLTYAADLNRLDGVSEDSRYRFVQGDILDRPTIEELLKTEEIDTIVNFAAESHVDRSIAQAAPFIKTNVEGTLSLLEAVRTQPSVHFHQVSTDEVFGTIETGASVESSPYAPNSPYSASKAAADHLVRSFANTYDLSTTISFASNNYGPGQHTEKLIPKTIQALFEKTPIPLYGDGEHVRNWIHVSDHAHGLWSVLTQGLVGESYNVGGVDELSNINLLKQMITLFCEVTGESEAEVLQQITPTADRPGHDRRYALNSEKLVRQTGWAPIISLERGLVETIENHVGEEALV